MLLFLPRRVQISQSGSFFASLADGEHPNECAVKMYPRPTETTITSSADAPTRQHVKTYVIVFFILGVCTSVAAQTPTSTPAVAHQEEPAALGRLVDAFRSGDSGSLMKHAGRRLDVTLFGMSELFSRSQAGYVLGQFFDEYRPERLEMTETSGSEGNWFAAGRYWYRRGEAPLAVYFRLRSSGGEWELREVRIGRTAGR